jgi:FKBP-type peptidyl-prolyl cis-trans isomerase
MLTAKFVIGRSTLSIALLLMTLNIASCTKCSGDSNTSSTPASSTAAVGQDFVELKIETLKPGTGASAASGKKVTVHYTGTLTDGKIFDSSETRKAPFTFTLGQGQVIPGWDKGVDGMKVGERRRLSIPSSMAYGEKGVGSVIPPNSPLVFEVELLSVE